MKISIIFIALFSNLVFANTGGLPESPMDEAFARAILIEQRIEREDFGAALGMIERHFSDLDEDSRANLSWQSNNKKKVRLLSHVIRLSAWNNVPGDFRALILKEALKISPMTMQLERELYYLLARTQSLEGMGTLLARSVLQPRDNNYAGDAVYPRLLSDWRHSYAFILAEGHFLKNSDSPVGVFAVTKSVSRWVSRFATPDELLAQVNKYSSRETLLVMRLMIAGNPGWSYNLSPQQMTRFNYWLRDKGCEGALVSGTQSKGTPQ